MIGLYLAYNGSFVGTLTSKEPVVYTVQCSSIVQLDFVRD